MSATLKKIIAMILCAVLVLAGACSQSGGDQPTPSAPDGKPSTDISDGPAGDKTGDQTGDKSGDTQDNTPVDPTPADPTPADPTPSQPTVFAVTIDPKNGDAPYTQSVTAGDRLQSPSDPVRQGFIFAGWSAGGEIFDFNTPVTADMTVSAMWEETLILPPEIDEIPGSLKLSRPFGGVLRLELKQQSDCTYTFDWYIDIDGDSSGGSFLCKTDVPALNLPLDHEVGDSYFVYCAITGIYNLTGASARTVSPAVEVEILGTDAPQPPAPTPDPEPSPDPEPTPTPTPTPDKPNAPAPSDQDKDPADGDEYYSQAARALIAAADAYVRRGSWIQYDDTRLVKRHSSMPAVYRPRRGVQPPELATAQNTVYTNCAAFINSLFWEAFDYDIVSWYTGDFIERKDMTLFYYDTTSAETAKEKDDLISRVKDLLQPGDLLVTRLPDESNGHIIMYVGNGRYVHSTGSNYNYSSGEVFEKNGSIRYDELEKTYFNPSSSRYLPKSGRFAVLRPLNLITKPIPQRTLDRMAKMSGIVAQKLTSHPQGTSANPGDTVSYTISVENLGTTAQTVTVTAALADGTTLVSGGDSVSGRTLSWRATVEAGAMYEVSYSVRIGTEVGRGSRVAGGATAVNGVPLYCADVYVANTLTDGQMASLDKAARGQVGSRASMGQIINSVYTAAVGDNVGLTNEKALFARLFSSARVGEYLNFGSDPMSVPSLYGGWYTDNSPYHKDRIQILKPTMLLTGDILFVADRSDGSSCSMYLVLEGSELLYMSSGGARIMSAEKATNMMSAILGKSAFCVLRPSLVF